MSSAQDPFYIVKEEIQESIDTLQAIFHQVENKPDSQKNSFPIVRALNGRKVDELEKAISVASRDPALYGINQAELDRRTKWTRTARTQVGNVKKSVTGVYSTASVIREELMRVPTTRHQNRSSRNVEANDDFITSESGRQMLLIRQQDEELDELSASVGRIGSVGLTIHDELLLQEKLIDELGSEMDSTTNRLDFVQKKVGVVMKKASGKGQMMMIFFLIVLFVVLFVLVF